MNNENLNPTPIADEEKKNSFLKWLKELWELIKFNATHSGYPALAQSIENLAETVERAIEQNDLNEEKVDKFIGMMSKVKGEMRVPTHEELMGMLDVFCSDDFFVNKAKPNPEFIPALQMAFEREFESMGKNPSEVADMMDNIRVFATEDKQKMILELDGALISIKYTPDTRNLGLEDDFDESKPKLEDILNADGTTKEGFQLLPTDMDIQRAILERFCEENGQEYCPDIQKIREEMMEKASPIVQFLASRTQEFVFSEDKRYESHYHQSDGSFRIRDTETDTILKITTTNGKAEFSIIKDAPDLAGVQRSEDAEGNTIEIPLQEIPIGSFEQKDKDIVAHIEYGSTSVASMFHSEEVVKFLESVGISEEQQKSLLSQTQAFKSEKVNEDAMKNVYAVQDACRKTFGEAGHYNISIRQSGQQTFVVVTDLAGKGDKDAALSFAFDKNGNAKAINFREEGEWLDKDGQPRLDSNGNVKNHRFAYMFSIDTKNVSPEFHRLQNDALFVDMFNRAVNALEEVGIDVSHSRLQFKKERPVLVSSGAVFDIIPEKDLNLKPSENSYANENYFATQVAKAAMYAFSVTSFKERDLINAGVDKELVKPIMSELSKLGVITSKGISRKTITTLDQFAVKATSLAANESQRANFVIAGHTESYVPFLPKAFAKHIEAEKEQAFGKLSDEEKRYTVYALDKLLRDLTVRDKMPEINTSYFQRQGGLLNGEAAKAVFSLEKMGIVAKGKLTMDAEELREEMRKLYADVEVPPRKEILTVLKSCVEQDLSVDFELKAAFRNINIALPEAAYFNALESLKKDGEVDQNGKILLSIDAINESLAAIAEKEYFNEVSILHRQQKFLNEQGLDFDGFGTMKIAIEQAIANIGSTEFDTVLSAALAKEYGMGDEETRILTTRAIDALKEIGFVDEDGKTVVGTHETMRDVYTGYVHKVETMEKAETMESKTPVESKKQEGIEL